MAGVYAVIGWLLAQAAVILETAIGLPAWFDGLVVALLLVGFPIAMILAWAFEMTPEGVKLTANVPEGERVAQGTGRKLDYAILGVLALVGAMIAGDRLVPERAAQEMAAPPDTIASAGDADAEASANSPATAVNDEPPPAPVPEKSVAVLPFLALSSGEDDGYFADGLTEEIINALTTVPDLLVTARTSAFHFKGKDTPVAEIAATLGVAHVVEGSVRRAGDRARITAQLIRAADGFHLWSETYDRPLDDVFRAQTDIAENVAGVLNIVLDEQQKGRMRSVGVRSVDAFIDFQKGKTLYNEAHLETPVDLETLRRANQFFESATARAPDFAMAHLYHSDLYTHLLEQAAAGAASQGLTGEEIAQARASLEASLKSAFETARGPALLASADFTRRLLSNDWRGLGDSWDKVLATPACGGGIWRRFGSLIGRAVETRAAFQALVECDPLDIDSSTNLVAATLWSGNAADALALSVSMTDRYGRHPRFELTRFHSLLALGRLDEAARAADAAYFDASQAKKVRVMLRAVKGDANAARREAEEWVAAFGVDDENLALLAAWTGDRASADSAASRIDARLLGHHLLLDLTSQCVCGAPFDLEATPNFARLLKEGDLRWPPQSPIKWPLKNW